MSRFPVSALWDFSLAVYGRAEVAPACLALQERHGIDVNLMLYCCWLGESGRGVIDAEGLARAGAAVGAWHAEVVRGLRAVRARLKRDPAPAPPGLATPLRKHVGAAEIEAEHIEQLLLAELAPPIVEPEPTVAERASATARNAVAYLRSLGVAADGNDREALATVLGGCFPMLAASELARLLAAE